MARTVNRKSGVVPMNYHPVEACNEVSAKIMENVNALKAIMEKIVKRANSTAATKWFLALAMVFANQMANANAMPRRRARIVK